VGGLVVGSSKIAHKSIKCECTADRSESVDAFHLRMKSSGVTRSDPFVKLVWERDKPTLKLVLIFASIRRNPR
jgi:hypothetical protein